MKRQLALFTTVAVAAAMACGGPPKTGLDRLYQGLSEPLPRLDPSILSGRRVILDPGHGGHFNGTMGRDSLEEASVNLGVSLYLWGLLTEAGAEVSLTRSIDRDFLTEADSSLAGDLQWRVDLVDSLQPDIFISIHHNAQPQRDPDVNSVETYYKAGDPASLDLAFAIHRHLMRNLGIENGEVRQGNYYVLRNLSVPAVLGESSYLTHPPVEANLRVSEKQKLEAEAYFLGILDYFYRGIPRIRPLFSIDSVHSDIPYVAFGLQDDGGVGIDPDGVEMTVNGKVVHPHLNPAGTLISYRLPWNAPNGAYRLSLTARNLLGNTSPPQEVEFAIDLPPEVALFDHQPEFLPAGGGMVRMRARLLDRRGIVIADGTPVTVRTNADTSRVKLAVRDGRIEFPLAVAPGTKKLSLTLECRGLPFNTEMQPAPDGRPDAGVSHALHVRSALDETAVRDAAVTWGDSLLQSGSATGLYFIPARLGEDSAMVVRVTAPGHVPVELGTTPTDTLELTPWFDGTLVGKRFVLDPEGGRARDVGMGQLGLSGGHVNLQVARYLAGYLRGAGAAVLLTRRNEEVRTPEDIARITNRYRADRYIEIRHRSARSAPDNSVPAVRTYHFPGSGNGTRMSAAVGAALSRRLAVPLVGPFSQVTYPLQQTACPAIIVEPPPLSNLEEELRLDQSRYQREQAYALFLGVLEHFEAPPGDTLTVSVEGPDPGNWMVTLDGTWTLLTSDAGTVVFEALPPGPHWVDLRKEGRTTRRALEAGQTSVIIAP